MLQDVKNYMRVTWDSEDADIIDLIERGKRDLSRMIGPSLDFEESDLPKQLLLDYCRYVRNNALEFFRENFAEEILFLSLQEGVKEMREKDGQESET